jgi:hypothetical protein
MLFVFSKSVLDEIATIWRQAMKLRTIIHASAVIGAVLLVSGCSLVEKDDHTEVPEPIDFSKLSQDSTLLVGTWEWKRSTYYFTGSGTPDIQTPGSTGRTETLDFTLDDTVVVYRNGELTRAITYQEYLDGTMWGVTENLLATSTAHVDGPESVYKRRE